MEEEEVESLREKIRVDPGTRYFLAKSCSRTNIEIAMKMNVWASKLSVESMLGEAFLNSSYVVLVFSVNRERSFCGCAVIRSLPGGRPACGRVFTGPNGMPFMGYPYSVRWLSKSDLQYGETDIIYNRCNRNQNVKIGKDGQELDVIAGRSLIVLLGYKDAIARGDDSALATFASTSPTALAESVVNREMQLKRNELPLLEEPQCWPPPLPPQA